MATLQEQIAEIQASDLPDWGKETQIRALEFVESARLRDELSEIEKMLKEKS